MTTPDHYTQIQEAIGIVRAHARNHPDDMAVLIEQLAQDAGFHVWLPVGDCWSDVESLRYELRELLIELAKDDHGETTAWVEAFAEELKSLVASAKS